MIIILTIYFIIGGLCLCLGINDMDNDESVNIWWCIGAVIGGILWPISIIISILMDRKKSEAK